MNDLITIDRFQELADAYGGVVARWPAEHRAAASRMALRPEAAAMLVAALALDETLDEWRVLLPTARLTASIVAAGPARRLSARMRLWWSGVGVATALAGAAAGMAAVALVAPTDAPTAGTSFGDVAGQDS